MSNDLMGEHEAKAGDRTWVLKLGFAQIKGLQRDHKINLMAGADMQDPEVLGHVVLASLKAKQPDATEAEADGLIDEIGIMGVAQLLAKCISSTAGVADPGATPGPQR